MSLGVPRPFEFAVPTWSSALPVPSLSAPLSLSRGHEAATYALQATARPPLILVPDPLG